MTYENFLQTMLATVPDDVDKREGSLIFTALAPVAAAYVEQQCYMDNIMDAAMPDTARGGNLTRKCAEKGINRYPASRALRKAVFTAPDGTSKDVPLGSRFGAQGLVYTVAAKTAQGDYQTQCQQAGIVGNGYFGALLPVDIIPDLGTATLTDVLVAGEDEETDDELRTRYYATVARQPSAGNIAYYEAEILKIPGVGAVKVYPTPDSQGGKVHCIVVDPQNKPASTALVEQAQQEIDPAPQGKGYGKAPIGHTVSISTVTEASINITISVAPASGYLLASLTEPIKAAIGSYLASLSFVDSVVRISRVESAVLAVEGVADVADTKLNGSAANITLPAVWDDYQVPSLGTVTITEVV